MKRLLFAIWLSWLAISMVGCASTWQLSSSNGQYTCTIPKDVPKEVQHWEGGIDILYQSPELTLLILGAQNPLDPQEWVGVLYEVEEDAVPHLVGISYNKHGVKKYFVDKAFMSGRPASDKVEFVPEDQVLTTQEIVKMRTGKDPLQGMLDRRGPARREI